MKKTVLALLLFILPMLAVANDTEGLEALRAAAERGDVDAQYELGVLYEFGYDFTDHRAAAFAWYARAADQGNTRAASRRDQLQRQLTAAELERARALLGDTASAAR